jgi:YD repeat-containing protein
MDNVMKNLFILIVFFTFLACSNKVEKVDEVAKIITVDVTKSYPEKELHLQDIADVKYIPLGSNNEFLISDSYSIAFLDNDYIILFSFSSGESGRSSNGGDILIYDGHGNPITHINRRGQNTGEEYTEIGQLLVDKDKEELFVFSSAGRCQFMVYDMKGNFRRKFNIPSTFNSTSYKKIIDYDKDRFIVYAKNHFSKPDSTAFLIISKQNGEIEKKITVPFEKIVYTTAFNARGTGGALLTYQAISPVESEFLLTELSTDTIYHLSDDYQLSPFLARTPSIQTMKKPIFLLLNAITNRYWFMDMVVRKADFENFIAFPRTPIVYDKEEKQVYQYTLFNDDYPKIKLEDLIYYQILENSRKATMVVLFQAYQLIEANEKGELYGELKEIASKLTDDDNPVLMVAKFK